MNLTINQKNTLKGTSKKITFDVEKCNLFGMFRGLMFRKRENAPVLLLFDFKKLRRLKIHSWFVFFPFLVVWLDDKDKIIEIRKINPWRFCVFPKKKFWKLIEIPCSQRYKKIIKFLDDD